MRNIEKFLLNAPLPGDKAKSSTTNGTTKILMGKMEPEGPFLKKLNAKSENIKTSRTKNPELN